MADRAFDPPEVSRITPEAIERNEITELVVALAHGRDVQQITRVTGYFSPVGRWNKGKKAELRDRHKTRVSS